jgi:hypothetical protein
MPVDVLTGSALARDPERQDGKVTPLTLRLRERTETRRRWRERESRHWRDSDRASLRRLSRDALSLHSRRANREHPGRLRTAALSCPERGFGLCCGGDLISHALS